MAVDAEGSQVDLGVRHRQDEYLEREAEIESGTLAAVTFVAEGYDYWRFVFERDPDYVVERYRDFTKDTTLTADDLRAPSDIFRVLVRDEDNGPVSDPRVLLRAGEFNWRNQANQGPGIVHLSHRANSLGAEIALAVTSALPRRDAAGEPVAAQPPARLMCCTLGGEPNRSSDPRIAAAAYSQVIDKDDLKRFTLTDPVGLYIKDWMHTALRTSNGEPAPREFWQVERGRDAAEPDRTDSRILRLRVEVPRGEGYLGPDEGEQRAAQAPGTARQADHHASGGRRVALTSAEPGSALRRWMLPRRA